MGKDRPEYVAHQYGMRGVSLRFVHAHSGHTHTPLCLGFDLLTDVLTGCVSNTAPQSVWVSRYHQTSDKQVQNSVPVWEMAARGTEIPELLL